MSSTAPAKFSLGFVTATPAALKAIRQAGQTPSEFLARHAACDWGEVCPDDAKLNDEALKDGSRLLSAYTLRSAVRIWVITEAVGDDGQRASTTILLPEEY
jgi:hypothetical protein